MRIVGSTRVSTTEQNVEAQRVAIEAAAAARQWTVVAIYEDRGASGRTMEGRPGLAAALAAVESGAADALVVAKLDRLSRSLLDFASLMERARRGGWAVIALDLGVDTSTPSGEMMASVLASFAQFERRLIGQRTTEALAVKKAAGVKLGRAYSVSGPVRERICRMRRDGMSLGAIAAALTGEGVPTGRGGTWAPETVRRIVNSAEQFRALEATGDAGLASSARDQNGQGDEARPRPGMVPTVSTSKAERSAA